MAKNLADATPTELRAALAKAEKKDKAKREAEARAKREAQRLKDQAEVLEVKQDFEFASSGISDWVAGTSSHNGGAELVLFDYTRPETGISIPPEDIVALRDWLNTLLDK